MTTTTLSARKDNRFDNGKDLEKGTPVHPAPDATPGAAQLAQAWFDAQALPILPLHLQLMLLGS
jgi:hypothetical protein